MGLFQRAVETYDAHADLAGVYEEKKIPLAPICHKTAKAEIEICIRQNGEFSYAKKIAKDDYDAYTIIPVSMESMARSGTDLTPHPLCDSLKYLVPDNEKEYRKYSEALTAWNNSEFSHPKLASILQYVINGTIVHDLEQEGILKKSTEKKTITDSRLVRWRVDGIKGDTCPECWKDISLFRSYEEYEKNRLRNEPSSFCMISGRYSCISDKHRGGAINIPNTTNPKLISTNDKITKNTDSFGFTFLGRFQNPEEAVTISYEASQKAHNALSWLDAEESVRFRQGGRTFLCWNPKGKKVIRPYLPLLQENANEKSIKPSDYKDALYKTLVGHKTSLTVKDDVVIAVFDSASKGRISVVYYNELRGSEFLDRLYEWDLHCCWPNYLWQYKIQSPTIYSIINYAFGVQRPINKKERKKNKMIINSSNGELADLSEENRTKELKYHIVTDEKIIKQQFQRLLSCRVDGRSFPTDIMLALVRKATDLQVLDAVLREELLFTACAVIRKHCFDKPKKEDITMALDKERIDRSYQFGRLLAILEKVERDTYQADEKREPNAIRLQKVFCQQPLKTFSEIDSQLNTAYYPRLSPSSRMYYKKLVSEIVEIIDQFGIEVNKPLKETYLLGYYLQRKELYTRKEKTTNTENN